VRHPVMSHEFLPGFRDIGPDPTDFPYCIELKC
jgi:hypothetical protein